MMHNFIIKPNTKNVMLNLYVPLVSLATDAESAPGIPLGVGAESVAYDDVVACGYARDGDAAHTAITLAEGTEGTYLSGGWILRDNAALQGWYQFGVPDAVLAHGAKWVDIGFEIPITIGASVQVHIDLVRSIAW